MNNFDEDFTITKHQINCNGKLLKYIANAGYLPICDQFGKVKGKFFYVAYCLDSDNDKSMRPITFVWNGGPGAPSSPLHFNLLGPRIWSQEGMSNLYGYNAVDNNETLLRVSDIVMVDPIGTGYSYPLEEEDGKLFWGVKQDIESIAEFIRIYLTHTDSLSAPLFLIGESYGTFRAAGIAEKLIKQGYDLRGVIFISSVFNMQLDELISMALSIPSWTVSSFYHKKLPPDLQKDLKQTLRLAEDWALNEYLPALMKGDELKEQKRQTVISNMVQLTGLPFDLIEKRNLRVTLDQYASQIFSTDNKFISHYDARLLGEGPGIPYDPTKDPALFSGQDNPFKFILYLRKELNFKSDRFYQGPFGGFWPPSSIPRADWMSYRWDWGSFLETKLDQRQALANAMKMKNGLQLFFASGLYDLTTPYFVTQHDISQLGLGGKTETNIEHKYYSGGHMMYEDEAIRIILANDIISFYNKVLQKKL